MFLFFLLLFFFFFFCLIFFSYRVDSFFKRCVMKSRLYNFDPLKPHFNIVILGFIVVYIIFLILLKKNIDCGYSLEPPRRGGSNDYPQSMF